MRGSIFGRSMCARPRLARLARLARHGGDVLPRAFAISLRVIPRRAGDHLAINRRAQAIIRCFPATRTAGDKAAEVLGVIHE